MPYGCVQVYSGDQPLHAVSSELPITSQHQAEKLFSQQPTLRALTPTHTLHSRYDIFFKHQVSYASGSGTVSVTCIPNVKECSDNVRGVGGLKKTALRHPG